MKTHDLKIIIQRCIDHTFDKKDDDEGDDSDTGGKKAGKKKDLSTEITLMHPVKPMLARPGKDMAAVKKRCVITFDLQRTLSR